MYICPCHSLTLSHLTLPPPQDMRRFMIGIGLRDYGGWEVSPPAICKQETKESWWCHSVQVLRPENRGHQCPRAEEGGCFSSSKEQNCPFSFLFYSGPQRFRCPPAMMRVIFTQSTDSSANNLFQRYSHTPRINVLPAIRASLSTSRWGKINHHSCVAASFQPNSQMHQKV